MALEGEVVRQVNASVNTKAFAVRPMTSNDITTWHMKEGITNWDMMFALAFTSYRVLVKYMKDHDSTPIDQVREMLIRLYMLEPSHTWHFVPPNVVTMIDFLFNITDGDTDAGAERRKRCAALFAQLMGKARGSGYRWLRRTAEEDNSVGLPLKKLASKLFSLSPDGARDNFWRAAFAMGHARGFNMEPISEVLKANGVKFD
jgi:hypothetical protein